MDLSGFSHYEVKDVQGKTRRGSYHDNLGRGFVMYQEGRRPEVWVANADTSNWYRTSHKYLGQFNTIKEALAELGEWMTE